MTGGGPDLARWGIAAPLEPLPHGHRNRVLRTRGLDPDLVFKSTRRGEAALAWLAPVHDAAEAVGWRVPRLVPSLRGRLAEAGWTAEPYVAGAPLPPERWPEIRGGVAGFHRRTALLQQRPGFRSAVALIAAPRGGDVDLRAMPPRLAAACRSAWRPLRGVPRTVVHGDLTPDNLHIDRRGRPVVMDWDERGGTR